MPIIVDMPQQGDFVGPGTFIRASTQSVLPVGHHWDALVFPTAGQDILIGSFNDTQGQFSEMVLGVQTRGGVRVPEPMVAQPSREDPGEYSLVVRVLNADSTAIIDTSGPVGIKWSPEPWGTAYVQSLQQGTSSGGFNPQDRTNLASILDAVQLVAPAVGGSGLELVSRVIDLVRGPPRSMLQFGTSVFLTGRGSLNPSIDGAGRFTYGAQWRYTTVPPELGVRDGALLEYHIRVAQFVLQRIGADSQTYFDEVLDTNSDDQVVLWQRPPPVVIFYDISPGVTVRWTWLV